MDISVVICAYTQERWDDLVAAVKSVEQQSLPANEIIVVIDHQPSLLARAQSQLSGVVVTKNSQAPGLSGARNSGIALARGAVIAFLDDDAIATPNWLAHLAAGYADPTVMGVGGAIEPCWQSGRPAWFPPEFEWVVGCTYRGMPQAATPVRNLIGANMSFQREIFDKIGGFQTGVGQVGASMLRCDDTEFCIRIGQQWPHRRFLYTPQALVYHRVPASRAAWAYFRKRCYTEGLAKALVARLVGRKDGLASERSYTLQTLPLGVLRGMVALLRGERAGLLRSGAIVAGLALTTTGYLTGTLVEKVRRSGKKKNMTNLHNPSLRSKNQPLPGQSINNEPAAAQFQPARLLEVEISQPLPAVTSVDAKTGRRYQRALALVRLHTQPLGMIEFSLPGPGLTPAEYARLIWSHLQVEITEHCRADGLPPVTELTATGLAPAALATGPLCLQPRMRLLANAPFVSVVVATHDRPASLAAALDALLALEYPAFEIIVVDNAPSNNATLDLLRTHYGHLTQVRYVREDRPGLAIAHNRGLQAVNAELVAFTDDDVLVDRHWLTELVQGFQLSPSVGCVTGMILPAEIETPAQGWIEHTGFNKGFVQRRFGLDRFSGSAGQPPLFPYTAGQFGSGANMAFRTALLRAMDGFDPALGAGSKALGGDDLAAFFQVIVHGAELVYQPGAMLYHWHRREYAGLQRQAYGYGVSLTAYLTHTIVDKPVRLLDILARLPYGLYFAFSPQSIHNRKRSDDYPSELVHLERKGMLHGPLAYWHSRWYMRRWRNEGNSHPFATVAAQVTPAMGDEAM